MVSSSLYFFFIFILCLDACLALNSDVLLLLQIKATLSGEGEGEGEGDGDGNPSLSTWTPHTPLCTWANITWAFSNGTLLNCTMPSYNHNTSLSNDPSIQAYSIALVSAGLSGSIPRSLSRLPGLRSLDLSNNSLSGGLPASIGLGLGLLQILRLGSNQLSGAIPASVWELCPHLRELRLDHNSFSSDIPVPASSSSSSKKKTHPCSSSLRILDFSSNLLSGPVPPFVGGFASLATLDLSNNRLRGAIPRSFTGLLALTGLNLSYNNLSGRIPHGPAGMSRGAYEGNPLLCGPPLPVPCAPRADGHMDKKVVAALVIGALAVSVVALAICAALAHQLNWGRGDAAGLPSSSSSKKKKKKKMTMMTRDLILGGSGDETHDDIGDGKLMRFEGGEHLGVDDVLNAPGEVLGKTSYGTVYKAKLGGGASMIALRLLREDTVKEKDEFMLGIRHLGQIRHPNVASLLAYYAGPKGEKLLVYNYLSRGSLFDLLYNRSTSRSPLSWARRHKIALGAARGLVHLHHGLPSQIIHGNLKSKNIVVDESFQGHLADYGLPLLMTPTAQSEMLKIVAKQGYRAPELVKMSRANPKTDVYNLGIVLLEILTGKPPFEFDDSENVVVDLPTYVKQVVLEERVSEIFDSEIVSSMRGSPIDDGLVQTLQLAMGCCAPLASTRPDIKEVVRQLEDVHPKVLNPLYTPTGMKSPQNLPL